MVFENARWTDSAKTAIEVVVDGVTMCVPVDTANRHYAALVAAGVPIADAG